MKKPLLDTCPISLGANEHLQHEPTIKHPHVPSSTLWLPISRYLWADLTVYIDAQYTSTTTHPFQPPTEEPQGLLCDTTLHIQLPHFTSLDGDRSYSVTRRMGFATDERAMMCLHEAQSEAQEKDCLKPLMDVLRAGPFASLFSPQVWSIPTLDCSATTTVTIAPITVTTTVTVSLSASDSVLSTTTSSSSLDPTSSTTASTVTTSATSITITTNEPEPISTETATSPTSTSTNPLATCTAPVIRNGNFAQPLNPNNDWSRELVPEYRTGITNTIHFSGSTVCSGPFCTSNHPVFLLYGRTTRDNRLCPYCDPYMIYRLSQNLDLSSCSSWEDQTFKLKLRALSKANDACTIDISYRGEWNLEKYVSFGEAPVGTWIDFEVDFKPDMLNGSLDFYIVCMSNWAEPNPVAETFIYLADVEIVPTLIQELVEEE
ncbi:hypothetical protein BJ508DRAFT_315882 [Ascobolus immersus RN42]|uniref:Uncharacterized protein n=1 Tax=Ascobolus immersus RN42 TaxID=1160509 RepID=A0A3N4HNC5_ASCIM|nr:hypothetical protein BJ508DRAFT_315882 [Ascobolus immersus RN42]